MERILLMIFKNFFHWPRLLVNLLYYGGAKCKATSEKKYEAARFIARCANRSGNLHIRVTGTEKLPEENGYIMFPNHQGLYDMVAMVDAHERPLRPVMKMEANKNFFVRHLKDLLCGLVMDREDVRQSLQVINQMAAEVKEGANYVIFPEGTRSKNGNKVGEFKGGSFKSATKSKCPIVPVAMIDCFKAFDTHSTEPIDVQVHFLEPIYYEEYKSMKTNEIADMVKQRIEKVISDNEGNAD